ncbi:MAG: hypothetical protein ACR2NR_01590 [Solirubrobacteraceae bacterium]
MAASLILGGAVAHHGALVPAMLLACALSGATIGALLAVARRSGRPE